MADKKFLIYGANGYTGKLCVERAREVGVPFVLGGRRRAPLDEMSQGEDVVTCDLSDASALDKALDGVECVLHCAGPFFRTAKPMIDACLRTGTHYLDITGEIAVFEQVFAKDREAQDRGVSLIPGVGFDVVPTDCIAAMLKEALPDADRLELAFMSTVGPSRGTAKTAILGAGYGGAVRENGRIKSIKGTPETKEIEFPSGRMGAACIPWGDVSTAYRSTGIPNIKVFMGLPPAQLRGMKNASRFAFFLRRSLVQKFLERQIDKRIPGPPAHRRERGRSEVVGFVKNANGETRRATAVTPDGYTLTALTGVEAAKRLLEDDGLRRGAVTPSMVFGAKFLQEFEGVEVNAPWIK